MWNHPQPNAQAVKKAEPKKVRGIFAGLIVIAVAGIAVVLVMMSGSSEPAKKDGKRKESARIREVTPAPAPKAKPVETVQMVTNRFGEVVPKKKAETYKDERGVLRYKVGNGRVPDPDAHKYLVKSSTVFTDGFSAVDTCAQTECQHHFDNDILINFIDDTKRKPAPDIVFIGNAFAHFFKIFRRENISHKFFRKRNKLRQIFIGVLFHI